MTTFDHLFDCRGTFIVPSFDEIWPQPGKERAGKARTRMGYDYILEAMQVTRMVLVMILMKIFLIMLMKKTIELKTTGRLCKIAPPVIFQIF